MKGMFSILQELYVFFSGHRRQETFVNNQEKSEKTKGRKKRLRRVDTTRWTSKNDSLKNVLSCFDSIKDTLQNMSIHRNLDSDTIDSSEGF